MVWHPSRDKAVAAAREALHDWLDQRTQLDWVDGELDDVSPGERAALAKEAAEEWQAEEIANEQADKDADERG